MKDDQKQRAPASSPHEAQRSAGGERGFGGEAPKDTVPDEAGSTALRRIPLTLTVRKEYEFLSQFLAEFGEHIYPEGMFIPSPRPKPQGALVKIDFRTHDGFQILAATCEVVRADESTPGTLSGMWVTFRTMDETCKALVSKIWRERETTQPRGKPPGIGHEDRDADRDREDDT